jgi:hypothetical protein
MLEREYLALSGIQVPNLWKHDDGVNILKNHWPLSRDMNATLLQSTSVTVMVFQTENISESFYFISEACLVWQ